MGLKLSAEAYLTKPVESGELIAQIDVMLRIKKVEDKLHSDKVRLEYLVSKRTAKLKASKKNFLSITDLKN